jgi:hypothetical protein
MKYFATDMMMIGVCENSRLLNFGQYSPGTIMSSAFLYLYAGLSAGVCFQLDRGNLPTSITTYLPACWATFERVFSKIVMLKSLRYR